ncbi:3-deoxy-7-phosphoheptulonate synthase [Candidatus Vidania fulgoroideorum]
MSVRNLKKREIIKIINGNLNKMLVFIGPCSIHNTKSCIKYAKIIKKKTKKYKNLVIVMRVFLEKPRTCSGWKGFIYDPDINGSFRINKGIKLSIKILRKINKMGVLICTEFLNPFIKDYIKKYISVGFIGARNNESQIHREIASSLSIPIGFKNNLYCDINGAINSILSCKENNFCFNVLHRKKIDFKKNVKNKNCFLVLRGGNDKTNYKKKHVNDSIIEIKKKKIKSGVVIDLSHGNSKKKYKKQIKVCLNICDQIKKNNRISGVMIESNILNGNQIIKKKIDPNISITDPCLSIKESIILLKKIDNAVEKRKIR